MNPIIRTTELQDFLRSAQSPVLLHVLPEEHFAQQHLPGAKNACIYETACLDKVREMGLDPETPIVVYGEGEPSLDSA
ncbi:MAG: rhodanese-like domain-containing protein, partial [Prosthecobacter sp.]|nr:rhodanese-like domain-containing protein [Prosthecobacter sp.]